MTRLPAIAAAFLIGAIAGAVIIGHWQPVGRFVTVPVLNSPYLVQMDTATGAGWIVQLHSTKDEPPRLWRHGLLESGLPAVID